MDTLNNEPVVVVCENPLIQDYLHFVLRRSGRRVILSSARHAIEIVLSGTQKVELLITNSPADFLSVAGDLPFLYLSAAPDREVAARFPNLMVLQKPFRTADLLSAVTELTSSS